MLKYLSKTTALSIFMAGLMAENVLSFPTDSRSHFLIGQTSSIQNFDWTNQPYCYMQTADGRVVNLERLCRKGLSENRSSNTVSSENDSEPLPIPGTQLPLSSGSRYARDNR